MLFDTLDAVIMTNPEGVISYWNQVAENLFGWQSSEVVGFHIRDTQAFQEMGKAGESILSLLRSGKPWKGDLLVRTKSGEAIPVILHTSPVFKKDGSLTGFMGLMVDISLQKEAEFRLRQSEKMYREVVENADHMIYTTDERGFFRHANKAASTLSGYSADELAGMHFTDLVHRDHRKKVLLHYLRQKHNRTESSFAELPFRTKDGELRWVAQDAKIILEGGKFAGFHVIGRDVTDRKKAEEERQRFFEVSMEMLCIAGFDGLFKELNSSWERVLGWSQKELMSRPFLTFVHPDDREMTLKASEELSVGKPVLGFENRYEAKDGSYKWLSWNSYGDVDKGMIYASARDITEQKQFREEITKLTRAIEQSPVSLVITDPEGHIEYANPKFSEISGYEHHEVLGKKPSILKSGITPASVYGELWKTITAGREWTGELCNKKKNGEFYWERVSISPVKNHEGRIVHFIGIKEDITQQKCDREKIEEQANFLNKASDAISVHDLDGTYRYWNRGAETLYGYKESEMLGGNISEILVTRETSSYDKALRELLERGEWTGILTHKRKDGREIFVQARWTLLRNGGDRRCVIDLL